MRKQQICRERKTFKNIITEIKVHCQHELRSECSKKKCSEDKKDLGLKINLRNFPMKDKKMKYRKEKKIRSPIK